MRQRLLTAALALASCALALLLVEGIYSVARWSRPHQSLTRRIVGLGAAAWRHEPPPEPGSPNALLIRDPGEIEALLDVLEADGVGLGNTPYSRLKTERASINTRQDGCLIQKPNLHKKMAVLRTALFEPFDPVTAFVDADAKLSPAVQAFLDAHAFRWVSLTTNEYGERITLPASSADRLVLVAGDSIANGAMLDDAETLSSQLQARDPGHRYVNLGIAAAHASDVVCALERAAGRYRGRVDRLVYVYCENDFAPDEPYGRPEQVLDFLRRYAEENDIATVTVVYAPYVYNIVPEITRFPGMRGDGYPHHGEEKRSLREGARAAGFGWIDFTDIGLEVNREAGSQFAVLALVVDHAHHSREGVRLVADRLLAPGR